MFVDQLKIAVDTRKHLAFDYDGQPRIVEPHALGLNKKGEIVLRAFQVAGGSATDPVAWKLFNLTKAGNLTVVDQTSQAPRPGYKPGDRAMAIIITELPEAA